MSFDVAIKYLVINDAKLLSVSLLNDLFVTNLIHLHTVEGLY